MSSTPRHARGYIFATTFPQRRVPSLVAGAALVLALGARPLEARTPIVLAATDVALTATALFARAAVVRARSAGSDGVRGVGELGGTT